MVAIPAINRSDIEEPRRTIPRRLPPHLNRPTRTTKPTRSPCSEAGPSRDGIPIVARSHPRVPVAGVRRRPSPSLEEDDCASQPRSLPLKPTIKDASSTAIERRWGRKHLNAAISQRKFEEYSPCFPNIIRVCNPCSRENLGENNSPHQSLKSEIITVNNRLTCSRKMTIISS